MTPIQWIFAVWGWGAVLGSIALLYLLRDEAKEEYEKSAGDGAMLMLVILCIGIAWPVLVVILALAMTATAVLSLVEREE